MTYFKDSCLTPYLEVYRTNALSYLVLLPSLNVPYLTDFQRIVFLYLLYDNIPDNKFRVNTNIDIFII